MSLACIGRKVSASEYQGNSMQRFDDKVVIATGATSGMGKATATRFSDEGAKLMLADRDQEKLQQFFA